MKRSAIAIHLCEHDLRADASRLSRRKTGAHPANSMRDGLSVQNALERGPEINQQRVIVAGVGSHVVEIGRGAVELVVGDVLHADPAIEPRPYLRSIVLAEELTGDLGDEPVAVRTECAIVGAEQRVGAAPGIKTAAGQDDFSVDAVAQGGLRPDRVQCVAGVGGKTVGEVALSC
jgi:hypothetical protein